MTNGTGGERPLAGRRVLVTRPRAQAAELVHQLEAAGATVVIAPAIRIVPPDDSGPLLRAAANVSRFDWIVFASANAVDALFSACAETFGAALPALPKVCAVGARTAERLRARGVEVAIVPGEFTADALVEALTSQASLAGASVLLPRSEIGRTVIASGLRAAGAIVTEVVAYRTVAAAADDAAPDVAGLLARGELDAVTFTSGSAVTSFAHMLGADGIGLIGHTVIAAIGPVTADAARELDVPVHVQPSTYTTAAMVEALEQYFAERGRAETAETAAEAQRGSGHAK